MGKMGLYLRNLVASAQLERELDVLRTLGWLPLQDGGKEMPLRDGSVASGSVTSGSVASGSVTSGSVTSGENWVSVTRAL